MAKYTKDEWSGMAVYRCTLCPFDSFSPDAMEVHTTTVHPDLIAPLVEKKEDKHGSSD